VVAAGVEATQKTALPDTGLQPTHVLDVAQLAKLVDAILRMGFSVFGPCIRDGAVVYGPIESIQDLPQGWTDEQGPGQYRLKKRDDDAFFGYAVGPQSWKKFLHPAEMRLWSAERQDGKFRILNNEAKPEGPQAFLGVRACELAAITIQDRVLLGDRYRDPIYAARREGALLVAVQCTDCAETCFCASMGTGPAIAEDRADLILTEMVDSAGHRFLVKAGSERGAELLAEVAAAPASREDIRSSKALVEHARKSQGRSIDTTGIKDMLYQNFEHPRWDQVAKRCLSCTNCTMVCPTCFCTTFEDVSDVSGDHAERWRRWDSCYTQSFSYIHGGSIRTSPKARYRQWLTHKLGSWIDQFGNSGCVGCGRCITWCPVGIDITEEVHALRDGGNHGNP